LIRQDTLRNEKTRLLKWRVLLSLRDKKYECILEAKSGGLFREGEEEFFFFNFFNIVPKYTSPYNN
jgi:hypothetical protein